MATDAQVQLIEDLMEELGLDSTDAAEMSGDPGWEAYDELPIDGASEMIDWLKEQKGR